MRRIDTSERPMPEINLAKVCFVIEKSRELLSEDAGVEADASNLTKHDVGTPRSRSGGLDDHVREDARASLDHAPEQRSALDHAPHEVHGAVGCLRDLRRRDPRRAYPRAHVVSPRRGNRSDGRVPDDDRHDRAPFEQADFHAGL